jgi:hypothetical protein
MPKIDQLIRDPNVKTTAALIYSPNKHRRKRFPDNCVFVKASEEDALNAADVENNLHPAIVCGPSRSSEGFMLYYLMKWLN